jgi:F0F1-type ATP synthase membrane subunit b/b'
MTSAIALFSLPQAACATVTRASNADGALSGGAIRQPGYHQAGVVASVLMRRLVPFVLLLAACSNAEEEKAKLSAVEKKAQESIAKAQNEAKTKIADLQKELEDARTKLTDAEAKAKEAVSRAETSAEEQAKAAEQALAKARQAYKEKARLQLSEVNQEMSEVGAKAGKVPAKSKVAFQKAMAEAKKAQAEVGKDIAAFDKATLETFRTLAAKVQQDISVMRAKIRAAKAKIP